MEELIRMERVGMRFDREWILRDVNFSLRRGDFVAVTGPNGGGKTTFLRLLLKLLKPTEGRVEYLGRDGRLRPNLPLGYLPQKSNIDTRFPLTAREVVMQGQLTGFLNRRTPELDERLEEVVRICGIDRFGHLPISGLSGGQLQRTLLARAIVGHPEVLMLDEPLSYVDKQFEHQIYDLMGRLARETTVVLVSHELTVISGMANRHLIIDRSLREI